MNLHPVSRLGNLSKVAEKIILSRFKIFTQINYMFIAQQFGFRGKLYTGIQLARIIDFITGGFNQNKHIGLHLIMCLDLLKTNG